MESTSRWRRIDIVLGGNTWRVLPLAGYNYDTEEVRNLCENLLTFVKHFMPVEDEVMANSLKRVEIASVTLLGEAPGQTKREDHNPKTMTSIRALDMLKDNIVPESNLSGTTILLGGPFSGMTVAVKQGQDQLKWYDRWELDETDAKTTSAAATTIMGNNPTKDARAKDARRKVEPTFQGRDEMQCAISLLGSLGQGTWASILDDSGNRELWDTIDRILIARTQLPGEFKTPMKCLLEACYENPKAESNLMEAMARKARLYDDTAQ